MPAIGVARLHGIILSTRQRANVTLGVVGVLVFGVLIALREVPHNIVARMMIAAAAGGVLGVVIQESRRSRTGTGNSKE